MCSQRRFFAIGELNVMAYAEFSQKLPHGGLVNDGEESAILRNVHRPQSFSSVAVAMKLLVRLRIARPGRVILRSSKKMWRLFYSWLFTWSTEAKAWPRLLQGPAFRLQGVITRRPLVFLQANSCWLLNIYTAHVDSTFESELPNRQGIRFFRFVLPLAESSA